MTASRWTLDLIRNFGATIAVKLRAAFVIRSGIEDTAIFSGIYRSEPLIAAIDAMIADEDAYARFEVAHAPIPA